MTGTLISVAAESANGSVKLVTSFFQAQIFFVGVISLDSFTLLAPLEISGPFMDGIALVVQKLTFMRAVEARAN